MPGYHFVDWLIFFLHRKNDESIPSTYLTEFDKAGIEDIYFGLPRFTLGLVPVIVKPLIDQYKSINIMCT